MEGEELNAGKDRVRECLINPLVGRGMVRKRGVTQDVHEKFLDDLAARLAYMTAENLKALAESVAVMAEGQKKNIWPADISICNWARRLQEPPVSVSRLVRTYLQSAAGHAARDGGYLVELYFYLKKNGTPPNTFAMSEIRRKGEDNRHRRQLIKERRSRGLVSKSDEDWFQYYMETRRRVLEIINAKSEVAA